MFFFNQKLFLIMCLSSNCLSCSLLKKIHFGCSYIEVSSLSGCLFKSFENFPLKETFYMKSFPKYPESAINVTQKHSINPLRLKPRTLVHRQVSSNGNIMKFMKKEKWIFPDELLIKFDSEEIEFRAPLSNTFEMFIRGHLILGQDSCLLNLLPEKKETVPETTVSSPFTTKLQTTRTSLDDSTIHSTETVSDESGTQHTTVSSQNPDNDFIKSCPYECWLIRCFVVIFDVAIFICIGYCIKRIIFRENPKKKF